MVVGRMVVVVIPANQIIFCTAVHVGWQNEMILIVGNVGEKSDEGTNAICIFLSTAPRNIHLNIFLFT